VSTSCFLIHPGVLTVGTDPSTPPQESINSTTQQPEGFDIDLITAIAQKLGLSVNVISASFNVLFEQLAAQRFDVVISGVTVTAERQQNFSFVNYIAVGESLLLPKGNPQNIHNLADLCGLSVSVLAGTLEEAEIRNQSAACQASGKAAINIVFYANDTQAQTQLTTNSVHVVFQDSTESDFLIHQNPGLFESVLVTAPRTEGIMLRKSAAFLQNIVSLALTGLHVDGTYHQLIGKWGLVQEQLPFNCTSSNST